jgi:hypothetical protein
VAPSSRRRLLFFLLVAGPLVACNAILGIDDFDRTECGSKPCNEIEAGPDRIESDKFVPDNIVEDQRVDAPPGVGPVSWAQFPMPNYKDASTPRPLDYSIASGGEEVEDRVTNLVWRRAVIGNFPGDDLSEEQAFAKCKELVGWRLPKRIELVTLLSHGGAKPFIDTAAFDRVPADVVWTSSEVRPFAGKYWAVDFNTGALTQLDTKVPEFAKALCVKDKQ